MVIQQEPVIKGSVKMKITKYTKGMSLIEVLISSMITLMFLGTVSNVLFSFSKNATVNTIKSNLDMDLRKAIERLEREISPARNIIETDNDNPDGSEPSITGPTSLVVEVPAYDKSNYPLYYGNGHPQTDTIYLKIDTTKNRLVLSYLPVPNSRRTQIVNQILFPSMVPIDSVTNKYITSDASPPKPFTYYAVQNEISANYNTETRTIKIVLYGQTTFNGQTYTAKRETEIRLRNSTN